MDELFLYLVGLAFCVAAFLYYQALKLRRERARFQAVLTSISGAVLAIDDSGKITLANPAATTLLSRDDELVGKQLALAVPSQALVNLVAAARLNTETAEFELNHEPNRRILATGSPLKGQRGVVVLLDDVTEMRQLETMRKDFVANVSHELRTPISVIRANAETLEDGALEDPRHSRQFLEGIIRNADRLNSILADLLDISRLESGAIESVLEPLSLAQSVSKALAELEEKQQKKQMAVVNTVESDIDVLANENDLEHVLFNLLNNALNYTPEGGTIELTTQVKKDVIRLEIKDNGPGIPPEHRTRIFERFYRVDPGRSRAVGGTGLGLAIVKHHVSVMGGSVGVEAVIPHGACFWVELQRP